MKATGRPISITIMSTVFIAAGAVGIVYHFREFNLHDPFVNDMPLLTAIRLLAIVGGVFALRGHNWARWLLLAWISYHVYLSASHPPMELVMHVLLTAVTMYAFFRPRASAYFR